MRSFAAILFSVIVIGAFGQLTTQTQTPFFHGAGNGVAWNGTPAGLGGLALRWNYTNGVSGGIGNAPAVINTWTDTVEGIVLTWNAAANQPICASTGVLFKATTGARDALTNAFTVAPWPSSGFLGGANGGGGTNISIYMAIRQINNNFGSGSMSAVGGFGGGSAPTFANVGAGTALNESWNGVNKDVVLTANQVPVDVYMTWSNGVFWAWTNGILAHTAVSWNVASLPWGGLSLGCEPAANPWHGNIAEIGIFTNVAFVTSSTISSTVVGVSNLHWYMTNYNVLQTNGVNSIFP